jgi:hypothetical protein
MSSVIHSRQPSFLKFCLRSAAKKHRNNHHKCFSQLKAYRNSVYADEYNIQPGFRTLSAGETKLKSLTEGNNSSGEDIKLKGNVIACGKHVIPPTKKIYQELMNGKSWFYPQIRSKEQIGN